ncbi:protein dopey homolog PFC0245c isoform X2 [Culicoides brevitarsis]|uniref:protein dopey homolog PFC0245c isoform X1 n=1 Tax=Culicoides brevitarsis TaxID=469753 RepID=UPI00307CAB77
MFPELTAISKILWIITVIVTSVFCSNVQLYSSCSNKHVHVYSNGSVFANDDSLTPQILTISTDKMSSRFLVTLYAQEVGMYLCFNKKWKLMGFKRRRACSRCHFVETMVQGYFRYASADDPTKFIGFRKTGKPVRPMNKDQSCYNFRKRSSLTTFKTQPKLPPLCVHSNISINNHNNSNSNYFPVNNPNKVFSNLANKNRLRNTTLSRAKQKRKKHFGGLFSSSNYNAHKTPQSNTTSSAYLSKVYAHNNIKNPKNLVSINTEKIIQNGYNENGNKFISTPKHKIRHSNSRHHHAKRSSNQKGLEIESFT